MNPNLTPVTRREDREQAMLVDAHDPVHQSRLPRLLLGLVALVPIASLIAILFVEGATRTAIGYFTVLWTGLLMLVFGGWMMRRNAIDMKRRLGWAFGFLLAAPLTLPLFWYRFVWNAPRAPVTHA